MRHTDDPLLPEFSTPRSLAEVGLSEHRVAQLVRAGSIVRVRHGHYARRDARTDLVRAVRVGGLLTSYPALKQWGLWCPPDDDRLHVSVNAHARALRDPDTGRRLGSRSDVVIHWNSATSLVNAGIVAPARAIRDLPPDLDPAYAVAAIDSALRIAACTRDEMVSATADAPPSSLGAASACSISATRRCSTTGLPASPPSAPPSPSESGVDTMPPSRHRRKRRNFWLMTDSLTVISSKAPRSPSIPAGRGEAAVVPRLGA